MQNTQEQALLTRVEKLQDKQLQLTCDIIAIPTVNPYSGDSSAAIEAPGQDWIEDQFKKLGAKTRRIGVPADVYQRANMIGPTGRSWEGRENVVAEWTLGNGDGPTILVNNHMDTVGAEGMSISPFDPVVKDGVIWGRGTSDTKGNTVMGLVAIEALLAESEGLSGKLIFESVVDEECNGVGAGTLACCLAGVTGDAAIVLDGGNRAVQIGCYGVMTLEMIAHGRAGHASGSASVNAIDKAIVAKSALESFFKGAQQRMGGGAINVGIFRAGTLPAIVPSLATVQVNMSYPPSMSELSLKEMNRPDAAVLRRDIEQMLADLKNQDAWFAEKPIEVRWIKDAAAFLTDENDAKVQTIIKALNDVHGRDVPTGVMLGWFDGSHLSRQLHIPVTCVGHGKPGTAHSGDEHADLDSLYRGAKVVALSLRRLLSQ